MGRPKHVDKCSWPKCESRSDVIWLGRGLCEKHWGKISEMDIEKAKIKLGMKKEKNVD